MDRRSSLKWKSWHAESKLSSSIPIDQGILALAKFLVTLGVAQHPEGLSLHLRQNFEGDREEILRIRLEDPEAETPMNTGEKPPTIV